MHPKVAFWPVSLHQNDWPGNWLGNVAAADCLLLAIPLEQQLPAERVYCHRTEKNLYLWVYLALRFCLLNKHYEQNRALNFINIGFDYELVWSVISRFVFFFLKKIVPRLISGGHESKSDG